MEYEKGIETGIIEEINPLNEYLDNIIVRVNIQAIRTAVLRIAIDPMYGVNAIHRFGPFWRLPAVTFR